MSDEHKPYSQLYINAWTILTALVSLVIFGMLCVGQHLLNTGHWIWDLIRYLASPII